jgi:Cu/Ag efflux protein CusF
MRRMLLLSSVIALAGLSACKTTEPRSSAADPRTSPVATSHPFEMKGKVRSVGGSALLGVVGGNSVTISRDNAPDVQLHVADKTRVTLGDRPARLSDLREGDEVRAVFDFDRDAPVAIDIVAKPK